VQAAACEVSGDLKNEIFQPCGLKYLNQRGNYRLSLAG
jgi:hypothetical protein